MMTRPVNCFQEWSHRMLNLFYSSGLHYKAPEWHGYQLKMVKMVCVWARNETNTINNTHPESFSDRKSKVLKPANTRIPELHILTSAFTSCLSARSEKQSRFLIWHPAGRPEGCGPSHPSLVLTGLWCAAPTKIKPIRSLSLNSEADLYFKVKTGEIQSHKSGEPEGDIAFHHHLNEVNHPRAQRDKNKFSPAVKSDHDTGTKTITCKVYVHLKWGLY